jgi:phage terminase large subunit
MDCSWQTSTEELVWCVLCGPKKAEADAIITRVARISKAAQGGQVIEGTTKSVAQGWNEQTQAKECLLAGAAGTGKTLCNLLRVYWTSRIYPGARCLIVRKTRESLTETVLVTWERDILGSSHPLLTVRPNLRRVRQSYHFPNGSEVVCGGIDKPDKILSSEYDLIYCPESTDFEKEDWETLGTRLRSGVVPYQMQIGECNPTSPEHWLYKRCVDPPNTCKLIPTRHQDNPRFWSLIDSTNS